ncbi:MAG TPA: IlvD/Edd family dehydratase [Bryobacteraceae bacterium]|nr:IlvD/Edd family dehydratase [Bryobacteraceae bacterium]
MSSSDSGSKNRKLRSESWYEGPEYYNFARRAYMRSEGLTRKAFHGKPLIGICNSWSELNHCNIHLRELAESVKRGVWAAGGVPLEFPTISLGEVFIRPTAMLLRNLMAMDVEESIRCNPVDGVVLLCGCDKTTPAQLMGAASADVPSLFVTGGPMLSGNYRGEWKGSGTDGRKMFDLYRSGSLSEEELNEFEGCMARSHGHCMVMGTASTMTSIAEALGMTLPGCASIPAPDSRRKAIAEESGRRIVEMVWEDLKPSKIMTRKALENAVTVDMAIGGSTNAVVHLIAIAGRLGVDLTLDDFHRISARTPYLVNVKPSGKYLMEEFFYAGGLPAVMREILPLLHGEAITVTGKTIAENVANAPCHNRDVILTRESPLGAEGGTLVLYGNLAPNGAVIKHTAASAHLLEHRGTALVFEDHHAMIHELERDDLPVDENTVIVLKNGGPKGGPGFPEWGHIPMPKRLLQRGVMDMVRISDARMSGTSFGTVVLHISPESAIGGPLAAVRTGDVVVLSASKRRIDVDLSPEEIERRLAEFVPPPPSYDRGYGKMFLEHVTQAHEGCDFDFLRAVTKSSGS